MIPWYRSWPKGSESFSPERARVVDSLPRLYIKQSDLTTARNLKGIGKSFVLIEWDIAISLEDQLMFTKYCEMNPHSVHIAPYNVYYGGKIQKLPMYREWDDVLQLGFGLIYFPWQVVQRFLTETFDAVRATTWFTDGEFSRWYKGKVYQHEDIHIIHLNYPMEGIA